MVERTWSFRSAIPGLKTGPSKKLYYLYKLSKLLGLVISSLIMKGDANTLFYRVVMGIKLWDDFSVGNTQY